ncbi:MAG: RDD family protein [Actinobacteria bacterium]|nr:RDD family protein [Actinomycetota bacterium]
MSDTPPPPPPPPAAPPPPPAGGAGPTANPGAYAGWGKRVIAYIIDYIPLAILTGIGYGILFAGSMQNADCVTTDAGVSCTSTQGPSGAGLFIGILCLLLAFVYWLWNRVFKMGKTGSSIGMGVAGTKAVKESTGEPLGAGLNFLRQILLGVDFWICYIGVLWPLWDSKRQCLISDKATGAIVLSTK